MKQRILITGAFGFLGEHLLEYLKNDYEIVCIVKDTKKNRQNAKKYKSSTIYWGNLLSFSDVENAIAGCDAIIHLAFSNLAEYEKGNKDASRNDIEICKNLLKAIAKQKKNIKFIFASSVAAYFYEILKNNKNALKTLGYHEYAKNKLMCENLIRKYHAEHCILRIGAVLPTRITRKYFLSLPNINPEIKMEFICINDLLLAIKNTIKERFFGTFIIGGGNSFRMLFGEFICRLSLLLKIKNNKPAAYEKEYYSDWLDTRDSQKCLNYQKHTFKKYFEKAL